MPNYTYAQLIALDVECGGLTRRQAVRGRQLDRRMKKAYRNCFILHRAPKCRMEVRMWAELGGIYDDAF